MDGDTLALVYCYLAYLVTLAALVYRSTSKLKTAAINLLLLALYSGYLLYNLFYNSHGGVGLVWLVYLMFVIGVHWLVNVIMLIRGFIKPAKA